MTAFTTSQWLMDKTGASSGGGMVVAKQEQAALAGAQALADGGTAADAAVAAAFVMNTKALSSRRRNALRDRACGRRSPVMSRSRSTMGLF